jgi:hypothetical protein
MIDAKMFPSKSKLKMLFCSSVRREDRLFENIYGYDDVKRLFRMALESDHRCSILLTGPPASAKTLFLQSLMKLKSSHFIDCSNATKSGVVDYVFDHRPEYLLLDELDKLSRKDQTFLLNLIETGLVSETKYDRTRKMEIKTSVFATSNNVDIVLANGTTIANPLVQQAPTPAPMSQLVERQKIIIKEQQRDNDNDDDNDRDDDDSGSNIVTDRLLQHIQTVVMIEMIFLKTVDMTMTTERKIQAAQTQKERKKIKTVAVKLAQTMKRKTHGLMKKKIQEELN